MPDPGVLGRAYRMAAAGGSDHPPEGVWERLACGELSVEEREIVFDHVTTCETCGQSYRALSLLRLEAHAFDTGAPAPIPTATGLPHLFPRRFTVGGLAALAAAALLLIFLPTAGDRDARDTGQRGVATLRSGSEEARPVPVEPVGRVKTLEGGFSWQAARPPETYVVELLDSDGEHLWTSPETTSTRLDWPQEVPRSAGHYYWRVTALPAKGGEPTVSKLVSFDLVP